MLTIHGKSISGMVTIGPLRIFRHQPMDFARTEIEKPETEVARFDSARNAAAVKMKEFYRKPSLMSVWITLLSSKSISR